ncbi:aspartyl-phosphate phosphatase Spo0E family protein [Heyndrickxia acidicola]|uniref:Aspartyl-phosphate phosphatase Spo0E family protein n=2 Tax=Heyndrickxia acidicola TaxID=209389 RepID=A0ABU6MB50_9BACI|nr:aspartyl-phosphate phosphatase Spo0E family protein [Heyndrickxia acidicola]MED1201889.1 aspartyl-phosphate phosphatase Spo0E family protein [Heyndrickxia acidicola]
MEKEKLSNQIENKRAELIELAAEEGLKSDLTIQLSQELDRLLNQYNQKYSKYQKPDFISLQ